MQFKNVDEILNKYGKYDRYMGRGKEYFNACVTSHQEDLDKYGYDIITKHDSNTGKVVSFFK